MCYAVLAPDGLIVDILHGVQRRRLVAAKKRVHQKVPAIVLDQTQHGVGAFHLLTVREADARPFVPEFR